MSEKKYYKAVKNIDDELEIIAPYTYKDLLKGMLTEGIILTKKTMDRFTAVDPEKVSLNTYKSLVSEETYELSGELTKEERNMEWEIFLSNLHKLKTRKQKLNEHVDLKYLPLKNNVFLIQANM